MDDKNTALAPSGDNMSSPLTPLHQSDMDVPPPPASPTGGLGGPAGAPAPVPASPEPLSPVGGSSPSPTSAPFSPPVVHEEVPEPEAPVTHPPEHDDAPEAPATSPSTSSGPTAPPPAGGNFGGLPPVITPPTKKGKGKIIAAIAAVVLLLISIPVGVILVRQNLEVREKAAFDDDDGGEVEYPYECETSCPGGTSGTCGGHVYDAESGCACETADETCTPDEAGPTDPPATPTDPPATPTIQPPSGNECTNEGGSCVGSSGVCANQGGRVDTGYSCSSGVCCMGASGSPSDPNTPCPGIENAGPLVHTSEGDNVDLGNQQYASCDVVASFVAQYGTFAGRAWAVQHTCQPNVAAACDGQNLITQSADVVQRLLGANGANACQVWVNQHNTDVNNCTTAPSCVPISVYKYPYDAQFKVTNLNSLKPGDPVKFCINASYGGSPQVRINGGSWRVAQENGSNGEKCFQYDIPGDATTLTVEGQL